MSSRGGHRLAKRMKELACPYARSYPPAFPLAGSVSKAFDFTEVFATGDNYRNHLVATVTFIIKSDLASDVVAIRQLLVA